MTVSQYLAIKRQENPEFANMPTLDLYQKLKKDNPDEIANLSIDPVQTQTNNRVKQTSYQRKADPNFVNSLFDWTDYGINEDSAQWAKSSYNNSITGLAYQLYNGEQRFNLDGYNPGMVEDIFSSVLSFMMPMDFASMFAGGVVGKGISKLAGHGVKTAAVENLTKKKLAEGLTKSAAKKHVDDLIEYGGHSALLSSYAPKAAGSIASASGLATFEGVRGGMQAAVDGEDVWKGIGGGVMHGGIMGGLIGAAGASLNKINAKLWNKAKTDILTPKEEIAKNFWVTGKGGQVLTEAGIFTAPEIKNVIMDENYSMRDLFRSYFVNAGMIGVLKAQHKGQELLWNKGKEAKKEYWDTEGKSEAEVKERLELAVESIRENDVLLSTGETTKQRDVKLESKKAADKLIENTLKSKDVNVTKEDVKNWESKYEQAKKDLERLDPENPNYDPNFKLEINGINNIIEQIQSVYGAMNKNINRYKKDNPIQTKAREAKLAEMESIKDSWKTEIMDKYNDIQKVKDQNIKLSPKQIQEKADAAQFKLTEAWETASESQKKNLRRGMEKDISETGVITNQLAYEQIQKRAETLLDIKKQQTTTVEPPKNKIETNKKQFEKDFDNNVNVDSLSDIAAENAAKKDKARGQADKLLEIDKNMQNEKYGDTPEVRDAYNTSKKVIGYIHRQIFRKGGMSGQSTELNKLVKFAKEMADGGKSIFEISNKDILKFINKENPSQATLVKLIKGLRQIRRTSEVTDSQLFKFSKKFELLKSENIVADVKDLMGKLKEGGGEGLQLPDASTSSFNVGQGQISLPTKKGSKVKYISQKLQDMFTSLIQIAKGKSSQPGHNKYLIRNLDGTALTTAEVTALTIKFFKKKNFKDLSYGEARLFRNAIEQWGVSKNKLKDISTPELKKLIKDRVIEVKDISDIVDGIIVGHGTRESMKETYAFAKDVPTTKKVVKAILKEYAADIKNKKIKTTISGKGYSVQEIRAGLGKLKNHKGDITYKDRNGNTKTIDKATVEAMFQYMLEAGPRLNEIAPDSQTLGFSEKYASKESAKIDYQLLSEAKSAESLVKASELVNQVKWVKKKFPQLHVAIKKTLGKHRGEYVLGQIQGHLIKIAKNKARVDTLPHEVSHHVVDVLKAMGDPFSKKLVKQGIKMFKGEEAFVEALGKYVSKQLPKSKMGRMRAWVARTFNHIKQYFGITNKRDVQQMQKELVSIIGGKVLSGKIPTDVMPLQSRIKVKYQKADTAVGKKLIDKSKKRVKELEKQLIEEYGWNKLQLEEISENILGKKDYNKLTVSDIERYEGRLRSLSDKSIKGERKNKSFNETLVEEVEAQYGISTKQRDSYFKDVFNTTIDKANPKMLDIYKSYVIKGKEIKPFTETATDSAIALADGTNMPSIPFYKRAVMTAADVLFHYGGKAGKNIAKKLWGHDATRSWYKGEGEVIVERIKTIVDKKTQNDYMHLLDKDLAKGALKQLTKLKDNFKGSGKNPYAKELREATEVVLNFAGKGKKDFSEARRLWEGLSKYYWNSLTKEISLNTKGNKEFQRIKEEINEKFINQYFARRVTRKALQNIKKESPEILEIIESEYRKLTKKDIKKAEKQTGVKKDNPLFESKVKDLLTEELIMMTEYGPTKVKPSFLKERSAQLPEYMTIIENGQKKLIKSYERSLDGTITSYVNGMAKHLATIKHFPEFTNLKGKFSFGSEAKLDALMLKGKGEIGAYAAETIKEQLGLGFSNKEILMSPVLRWGGQITNWSAAAGLSSPMSGLKNVLIQIPRSVAIYGTRNTVRGIAHAYKAMKDPKLFEQAMREGQIGYGTRELIRKEAPIIKWWFDNVNGMTTTENFNRIVLAEAGKLHFGELLNVAKGKNTMFHPQGKKSEIMRMFVESWKLSESDIKFLIEGKNISGTKRYQKILERVGFESHKAGAGATGTADLPLWMSNKYIAPFTLFQRMATSVTIDSYKNYVKPMKNGNLAPILKATIGHGLSGAAMYWIYDKFMGQQVPVEESPPIDRAISYLWKGEFLGMFGDLISPYDQGMSIPIMDSVVKRNAENAWSELSQVLKYGKGADQAAKDFALKTVILANQAKRIFDNFNHPYSSNYKRMKTLRRSFNKSMGYTTPQGSFLSARQPYYYKLKTAIMYGKTENEIALAYYNAFNYINSSLQDDGITSVRVREKKARQAIDAVIRHMHPINLPDSKDGRIDSKRNEFLNYLSEKNQKLALTLEKEFKYKERQFYKIINQYKYKRLYSIHASAD